MDNFSVFQIIGKIRKIDKSPFIGGHEFYGLIYADSALVD